MNKTSSEDGYLSVTGHSGFEKTVSTIRNLMAAGISVQVAVTPSSYMKEDYIYILRFCQENGFAYSPGEFSLIENQDEADKKDHYLSVDDIVALSTQKATMTRQLTPTGCVPPCGGSCMEAPKA